MISARSVEHPLQMFTEKHLLKRREKSNMLKLMKYEFYRQQFSKGFIAGMLSVLVVGFFGFYFAGIAISTNAILLLMALATMMIIIWAPLEFLCFLDKDRNTRQGYLLQLVPHKTTTILCAKLLVALLQSVVLYTLFFTIVPMCERLCFRKFGDCSQFVGNIVRDISSDLSGAGEIIMFFALALILWLFIACLGMFVTVVFGKGKLASVLIIVCFVLGIFITFFLLDQLSALLAWLKVPTLVRDILEWVYLIGIDAALFFGTAKWMDKKVSI